MYTVTSLFTGMGGMDVGFAEQCVVHRDSVDETFIESDSKFTDFVTLKRHPFTIVMQNDIEQYPADVARMNGWAHNYVVEDIRKLIDSEHPFPESDVVVGGFPCQDFSILNPVNRKGFASERGTLYRSFIDVIKRVRPKIFVAENVKGMLSMPGVIEKVTGDFSDAGYVVAYQVMKCEEFGMPQARHRLIIMGVAKAYEHRLGDKWNEITKNKRACPCGKYFEHLPEPEDSDDPAHRFYSKCKAYKHRSSNEIVLTKATPTVRANHHGSIEFRRKKGGVNNEDHLPERRMSVREAALLQTFNPDTQFYDGSRKPSYAAYVPIGNAVPPLLGYLVADKVKELLNIIMTD